MPKLELDFFSERLDTFRQVVAHLPAPELIKEKLIKAYSLKVGKELADLLEKIKPQAEEQQLEALKNFLNKNWHFVQGSLLSYTALPQHELTLLLSGLAEYVVAMEKKKGLSTLRPIGVLEILMPGLSLESLNPSQYRHLYPIAGSELKKKISWNDVEVSKVLNTHILGKENYLIPIALLAQNPSKQHFMRQVNPYFDIDYHSEGAAFFDEEEYTRLTEHSSFTRMIANLQQEFELLSQDQSNFLNQLNQLINALYANSTAGKGTEEICGEGVYIALVKFIEYYRLLSKDNLDKIPEALQREIQTLMLYTEKKDNVSNYGSCIATRRLALIAAIENKEILLSKISIDPTKKTELLQQVLERLEAAKKEFLAQLKQDYEGEDSLTLTTALMEALDISWEIQSKEDLNVFSTLEPIEITKLLMQKPGLARQCIKIIEGLENFIIFCLEMSVYRLKALFSGLKTFLREEFIQDWEDLAALLIPLDLERTQIICEALQEELPLIFKNVKDFPTFLNRIGEAQKVLVFNHFIFNLPQLIGNDSLTFNLLAKSLAQTQRILLFNTFRASFANMIANTFDFSLIISAFAPKERALIFEDMFSELPKLIKICDDFCTVMEFLVPNQRTSVFKHLQDRLCRMIYDAEDFNEVSSYLAPDESGIILAALKDKLHLLIQSSEDFKNFCHYLIAEQSNVVLEALLPQLPSLIKDNGDLRMIVEFLNDEQRGIIFRTLGTNKLSALIVYSADLCQLMTKVKEASLRCWLLAALSARMPSIIVDVSVFGRVMSYCLTEQERALVVLALAQTWPQLIDCHHDFWEVKKYLNKIQKHTVLLALRDRLPHIIFDSHDFNEWMRAVSPWQRAFIIKCVEKKLRSFITTSYDFKTVITHLSTKQIEKVIASLQDDLPWLLRSLSGIYAVTYDLKPEQSKIVLEGLSDYLPFLIKDSFTLSKFLKHFNNNLHADILEILEDSLSQLIKNAYDFGRVLRILTMQSRAKVFKIMLPHLLQGIKDGAEFCSALEYLTLEQRSIVFKALANKVPKIVSSLEDLIKTFKLLPEDLCISFAFHMRQRDLFKVHKNLILNALEGNKKQRLLYQLRVWDNPYSTGFWTGTEVDEENNESENLSF